MQFFTRMSPVAAYKDLRAFLSTRGRIDLAFLAAAMLITGFFVYAFAHDSRVEPTYKRDILYVEQWPATRTDAEIVVQQKIDAPIKARALKEQADAEAAKRASFKRLDDKLSKWGL